MPPASCERENPAFVFVMPGFLVKGTFEPCYRRIRQYPAPCFYGRQSGIVMPPVRATTLAEIVRLRTLLFALEEVKIVPPVEMDVDALVDEFDVLILAL